jgi:hypothetical protein
MATGENAAKGEAKHCGARAKPSKRHWSAEVTTDSTHPERGLFLKAPGSIAKELATKRVSPKGPASGMRMLNFYINRAGKNLPKERLAALEEAKEILSDTISKAKTQGDAPSSAAKNAVRKKSSSKSA